MNIMKSVIVGEKFRGTEDKKKSLTGALIKT